MTQLARFDHELILATQAGLPLLAHPYQAIAETLTHRLGEPVTEQQVLTGLQTMLDNGLIRRIGAVPNHYLLGYRFNGMTVWDVPDEQILSLGEQVGRLPFVSHCYQRPRHLPDWPYNLFAMVHGKTRDSVDADIAQIQALLGPHGRQYDVLFSTRILKKTGLRLAREG